MDNFEIQVKNRPSLLDLQVLHEQTGLHANTTEEVTFAAIRFLQDPELARRLGAAGREHVREHFILPVYLECWLEMLVSEESKRGQVAFKE